MKTRTDFVSNSSSSSFICALEDNKYGVLLQDFKLLNFDQYFEEFGSRDLSEYWGYYKDSENVEFVTSSRYSKMFGNGVYGYLPTNAKSAYDRLIAFKKTPKPKDFNDPAWKERTETEQKLFDDVKAICKKVLEPNWKDAKFCYLEIDDNECSSSAEAFDCYSNEDLAHERFNYIGSIKPLKFMRVFSNH